MKKFKHKNGHIAHFIKNSEGRPDYYRILHTPNSLEGCDEIPTWLVENSNDWKEIVGYKLDGYTIMNFQTTEEKPRFTYELLENGKYKIINGIMQWSLDDMLYDNFSVKGGEIEISSVRVDSTGKTVSIGDISQFGEVVGFTIDEYGIFIDTKEKGRRNCWVRGVVKVKQIPLPYTVVAYYNPGCKNTYHLNYNKEDGKYHNPNYAKTCIEPKVCQEEYVPVEVKIEKTGEVLKAGDTIIWDRKSYSNNTSYVTVREFIFRSDKLCIILEGKHFGMEYLLEDLCKLNIKKTIVKAKLFVSEDGVDVFEGDSWFYVIVQNKVAKYPRATSSMHYKGYDNTPKEIKRFASQLLAIEFMRQYNSINEKRYSVVDIMEAGDELAVAIKNNLAPELLKVLEEHKSKTNA